MFYNRYSYNHHSKFLDSHTKYFQEKNFTYLKQITISSTNTQTLLKFDAPVKIKPIDGLSVLVLFAQDLNDTQSVIIDSELFVKPQVAFNILAIDHDATVQLLTQENIEPQFIKTDREISTSSANFTYIVPSLLAVQTIAFQEDSQSTLAKQDQYELVLVEDGCFTFQIKGKEIELTRGQLLVIPPQTSITRGHSAKNKSLMHTFKLDKCLLPQTLYLKPLEVSKYIAPLLDLLNRKEHGQYFVTELLIQLNQLGLNLINYSQAKTKPSQSTAMREKYDNELFIKILEFINSSDIIALKVNDLVSEFNVSRSTLQQLFNKYKHVTPKIYINQLRLEKSRQLIRESDYSITEIATMLGYGSIQYFSRAFSKEFHISPSEYAKGYAKRN